MPKQDKQEYVNKVEDEYKREESKRPCKRERHTKRQTERNKSKETMQDKRIKRHKGHMNGKRQPARGDRAKRMSIHPVEKVAVLAVVGAEG